MRAGQALSEIVIEKPDPTKTGSFSKRPFAEFARIPAVWREEAGDEILAGDTMVARRRGYWMCQWFPGPDETMRIREIRNEDEGDQYYQILTAENVGQANREWRFRCFEMPVAEYSA